MQFAVIAAAFALVTCGYVAGKGTTGELASKVEGLIESHQSKGIHNSFLSPTATAQLQIDRKQHCRHIALATLTSQHVEFDDKKIIIHRDLSRPGSPIEQFADLFGHAIDECSNPTAPDSAQSVLTAH